MLELGGIMKKSARKHHHARHHTHTTKHPSDSVIIQFGVAFIVVAGFALLMYTVKYFLP